MLILETMFRRFGTIYFPKNTTQKHQNMCHKHVYKTSLKLDFRPILDAYNLLGYGETLSEKSGKFKKNNKKTKISIKFPEYSKTNSFSQNN